MENYLVIVSGGTTTTVYTRNEWEEIPKESRPNGKVSFLKDGEKIEVPMAGTFNSNWAVFKETGHSVEISWIGELAHISAYVSRKQAEHAVKLALANSGLTAKEFLHTFARLFEAGEFEDMKYDRH
jgi:hypothetical protein